MYLTKKKKVRQVAIKKPKYMDRYPGRPFLILGGAPSLNTFKDEIEKYIEKYDPIIMGGNHITPFRTPHYHGFSNRKRFSGYSDTIQKESRVLLSPYFDKSLIESHYQGEYEWMQYLEKPNNSFDIKDGVIQTGCRQIPLLLSAVAIVMGGDPIHIVGMDGFQGQGKGQHTGSSKPLYFTHMYQDLNKSDQWYEDVRKECETILLEINLWMKLRKKQRLSILTPTVYKDFYESIEHYL